MAEEPIEQYKADVKAGLINAAPYDRLMIHYRKEKNYAEELKVIKQGIASFKKYFAQHQRSAVKKKKSKIEELSRMINKSTGLTDKKGNELYLPEPLPKWMKREAVVEAKLKKKKP
jgi:hypothetical protein